MDIYLVSEYFSKQQQENLDINNPKIQATLALSSYNVVLQLTFSILAMIISIKKTEGLNLGIRILIAILAFIFPIFYLIFYGIYYMVLNRNDK